MSKTKELNRLKTILSKIEDIEKIVNLSSITKALDNSLFF
jgi:hypothetical protein